MEYGGVLLASLLSITAMAESPIDRHYCEVGDFDCSYFEATEFMAPANDVQKNKLITNYLLTQKIKERATDDQQFLAWAGDNNDKAASFLAITNALEHLQLFLKSGRRFKAIDLIESIEEIRGDRLFVHFDAALFEEWRKDGAVFRIIRDDGKIEHGHFNFDQGDLGGSLHKGFDIQGYTSYWRAPRIQFNYRFKDNLADVDLDVAAWTFGFIPNPDHLTYEGSDTRQWYSDYVNKMGNAGFNVKERFSEGN